MTKHRRRLLTTITALLLAVIFPVRVELVEMVVKVVLVVVMIVVVVVVLWCYGDSRLCLYVFISIYDS